MGLSRNIEKIRVDFRASRVASIKEGHINNLKRLKTYVAKHSNLAESRGTGSGGMLSTRMKSPQLKIINERTDCLGDENIFSSINPANLPYLEQIPRYATSTYLAKNMLMDEDDSIIGKNITYHKDRGIQNPACRHNEDEDVADNQKKYKFTLEDDHILRILNEECDTDNTYKNLEKQFVGASDSDIQERAKLLKLHDSKKDIFSKWPMGYLDNSLNEALDSFDILFCRRCLVFDCNLHGCSQPLINSIEKKPCLLESEVEEIPCGNICYLRSHHNKPRSSKMRKKSHWKPVEKDLVLKGIEMFGRKSCLIARNLLVDLRTCDEVFRYMKEYVKPVIAGTPYTPTIKGTARKRMVRRKRGSCKLRFSSKSNGRPSRNIGHKNVCEEYTPCECLQPLCGPECSCILSGTCCEKYCGCSKNCKNRYRGCYCPLGQCRTQLCPCFVAVRECDPDVCRNCWFSCGDDILGSSSGQGESPCDNMQILRKKHQRILLGRSDVCGWGAFLKNTAEKNDYLGEYTGEMISHLEAEERGKVYDHINRSYLFNLNDQRVLDAFRKGNKLKFANHSFEPNSYAKVMFVGGDHRIGIYADKQIEAGEELFYDYGYAPGVAPLWAQKPDTSREKNNSAAATTPRGSAKKHHKS